MIHAVHAIHAANHARIVLQALPLATLPVFANVVIRQFTDRRRHNFNGDPAAVQRFAGLSPAERATYGLLTGHVPFGIDALLPEQALYLTMLRDPVERIIAFYFLVLSSPDHYLHETVVKNHWTLDDLIKNRRPEIDNVQIRCLNPAPSGRVPFGQVTPEMLQTAKDALEKRYIFGLAERLDESLVLFSRTLGWSDVSYSPAAAPPPQRLADSVDPSTIARIREVNQHGIELYEHARALFDQRVAALGPSFATDLSTFREYNLARAESSVLVAGKPLNTDPQAAPPLERDIVWLASYPRSGNTWLRFLLDSYFFPPAGHLQEIGRLTGELDWWLAEAGRMGLPTSWIAHAGHQVRERYPRPPGCPPHLFFKTHFPLTERHHLRERTRSAIYLIRNPRDVLLSGMNFTDLTSDADLDCERGYALNFILRGGDDGWIATGYGSWADHAASWLDQTDVPVLSVRYEDLKADTPGQFRRILEFIGAPIDEDRLARAIELCSLSRLRNLEVASRATTAMTDLKKKNRFFFNQGLSGQSLLHLGEDVERSFREAFADSAARRGYSIGAPPHPLQPGPAPG